jgi:tetratricopeptide (TPR) repeat protein
VARGDALIGAGGLAYQLGDLSRARSYGEDALELFRTLGDVEHLGLSWKLLGLSATEAGAYDEAARYFEEALGAAREVDPRSLEVAHVIANLGDLAMKQNDYAGAITLTRGGARGLPRARER